MNGKENVNYNRKAKLGSQVTKGNVGNKTTALTCSSGDDTFLRAQSSKLFVALQHCMILHFRHTYTVYSKQAL